VTAIATIATAQEFPVAVFRAHSMTLDVAERLLFLAAGSDAERVRVVRERCDRRRLSSQLWQELFDDTGWGSSELSFAIEDASEVANNLHASCTRPPRWSRRPSSSATTVTKSDRVNCSPTTPIGPFS
jgi:hypothetical protein